MWLADCNLAAAVSNAGALGIVCPMAGMERHGDPVRNLKKEIDRAKGLTEKPFDVNIPLDLRQSGMLIDIVLEEKVRMVVTASGDSAYYTALLHHEGSLSSMWSVR